MADWSTIASKKTVPTRPSPGTVQANNGSTWANAAGRKAGNGNVSQISRAPVQSKDKNPKRTAPVDPVASQQAAMRAIAKEALEHAMDSRGEPSDVEPGRHRQTRRRLSVREALAPMLWHTDAHCCGAPDSTASAPADLAVMTAAVQQHKDGGEGTDALWRAQAKVKELTQLAKQARITAQDLPRTPRIGEVA